jgi:hypothetical protein
MHASLLHWHSNNALAEPRWLVKKILPETGVALMSGQWSTGKTFMALHLANCVAREEPFAGHKIKRRGGTLLFAAEAAGDIPVRLRAIASQELLPFAWVDQVPKLCEPGALNQLVAFASDVDREMQQKFGVPLALILVDTMSAAAGFKDENSAAEVQPVMDVLHELARMTGTLVLVVDHYGKAIKAGTRGSNAKESSADAVLELAEVKEGIKGRVMTVRKLRSGPSGSQFAYYLEPVSFGLDQDGDEITTCIVKFRPAQTLTSLAKLANPWKGLEELKQALDVAFARAVRKSPLGDGGSFVDVAPLEAVRQEFYSAYPVKDGDQAKNQETRRRAFNRHLNRARDDDLICTRDINAEDLIWIVTK